MRLISRRLEIGPNLPFLSGVISHRQFLSIFLRKRGIEFLKTINYYSFRYLRL